MKISKDISSDGTVPAPAVTICTVNPETGAGWKSDKNVQTTATGFKDKYAACEGFDDHTLLDCINAKAYDLDDIMMDSKMYVDIDLQAKELPGSFTTDLTWPLFGKCHTYLQDRMSSQLWNLTLPPLSKAFDYRLLLHDPQFYFLTTNPKAFPGTDLLLPKQEKNSTDIVFVQNIEIIKHKLLKHETNTCDENPLYDFSACLRNAVNKAVGCNLPWQSNRPGVTKMRNCTKLEEYNKNAALHDELAYLEQKDVLSKTNCQLPCSLREIKAVNSLQTQKLGENNGTMIFTLSLVTTDIRVETEALVYNCVALVSNFGGALGLFLGFSFFMLWDWITFAWLRLKK